MSVVDERVVLRGDLEEGGLLFGMLKLMLR